MQGILLKHPLQLAVTLLFLLLSYIVQAQCSSEGPKSPGTATIAAFPGSDISFSNTAGCLSSDNDWSSANALVTLFNGQTGYLQASDFAFSIPLSAIICGIEVSVEKSATGIGSALGLESYITDYSVQLVKNGTVTGANRATANHWTSTDTYYTYGGNSDLWGTTWLPADINASNFGIAFSAELHGVLSFVPNARIDHMRITVYYLDIVLPVKLVNFSLSANDDESVLIQWKTAEQDEKTIFTVQRSADGRKWETLNDNAVHATAGIYQYQAEDPEPYSGLSYYRLQLNTASGKVSYSAARSISMEEQPQVKVFPNPFTSHVQITTVMQDAAISLVDAYGRQVPLLQKPIHNNQWRLDLSALRPGIYIISVGNKKIKIMKR